MEIKQNKSTINYSQDSAWSRFFFFFNKMESYVTITLSTLCNNPDLDRDEISLLMRQETLMEMFYFIEKQQKN